MQRDVPTVGPGTTVQGLLDEFIAKEFQRAYLVSLGDSFQGLVSISDVRKVPPEERSTRFVTEIMTRRPDVVTVSPDDPLEAALQKLASQDINQLVVVENERPVGLVCRKDIFRVLEVTEILADR